MPDKNVPLLQSAALAYENPVFLNSPEGRIIRILSEYSEPLARFQIGRASCRERV